MIYSNNDLFLLKGFSEAIPWLHCTHCGQKYCKCPEAILLFKNLHVFICILLHYVGFILEQELYKRNKTLPEDICMTYISIPTHLLSVMLFKI